jgi:hypothetical protein
MWINGNMERITFPEGVTEGRGSALWELPAGLNEAELRGSCRTDAQMAGRITHLAVDTFNRGTGEIDVTLMVEASQQVVAQRRYHLREWSNQRLLLPLPQSVRGDEIQVSLKVGERPEAVKLVLDNLRVFIK